jgi:hypothetical protein
MKTTCTICLNEFDKKTNGKYCSPACTKVAGRLNYAKRLTEKACDNCNQLYVGSRNSCLCENCKDLKRPKKYQTITANLTCTNCEAVIGTYTKALTKGGDSKPSKVCDKCKEESRRQTSERLKQNNPMHDPAVAQRVGQTLKTKFDTDLAYREQQLENMRKACVAPRSPITDEQRERARERMINDNPMKNPEIKAKVQTKLKGSSRPKGPDHGNWKGNRERAQTIRTRLYPVWTFPHLEKAQFKCEVCGTKDTKLEVHHESQSFKSCLEECLNGADIKLLTESELEHIIQLVIKNHEQITGKVVCVPCHRKIDPARR